MSGFLVDAVLTSVLAATLRIMAPLLISALGELVTQRAGIWNIGVEGTMLIATFVAYFTIANSHSLVLATFAAILAGMMVGLFVAFMTATLRVDQFIVGLGINIFASGSTLFWFQSFTRGGSQPTFAGFDNVDFSALAQIPIIGPVLFAQQPLTYLALLFVPVIWFLLYRTRQGLELRSLGENPKAIDVKGLSVSHRQYAAVILGSGMTGLAGAALLLGTSDRFIPEFTAGRGWIVVVAIIAGNWKPVGVLAAVFAFALLAALAAHLQVIGVEAPRQLLLSLPYLASIILLMGVGWRSGKPVMLGVPYTRE